MGTATILSIAILIFSVILFIFHFYMVSFQKKLQKALENKKLSNKQREEDQERLRIISNIIMEDNTLRMKVEQELKNAMLGVK